MRKLQLIAVALFIGLILAACGNSEENSSGNTADEKAPETTESEEGTAQEETTESEEGAVQEEETKQETAPVMEKEEVVAVVNGQEIKGEAFNLAYTQTEQLLAQYGQKDLGVEQLKQQTVKTLIDQELLRQDAEEKGISADEAKVNENYDQVKSQFETEEKFKAQLKENNLTEDILKKQLAYSILLDKYMKSEVKEVEITEQEVKDYYQKLSEQSKDVPPLEEVEEQLRTQLVKQEEQKQISSIIEELRAKSEIEKKV